MASGDENSPAAAQLPSQVQVTVVADARGRPLGHRIAKAPATAKTVLIGGVVLLVAAVVALVSGSQAGPSSDVGASSGVRRLAHEPGPPGVAAAYGFPLRCLTVTILPSEPVYARADFNRGSECGRYNGAVTAIFERADGAWRPVLRAVFYSCPVASLPGVVQVRLAICPDA